MDSSASPPAERSTSQGATNGSGAGSVPQLTQAASTASTAGVSTSLTGAALPERSPSRSGIRHPAAHRQSLAENLRNLPPSPRSHRHPSFTQQAAQDLLNHPPPQRQPNPRFAGRDWYDIAVGELLSEDDATWAEMDTSVEECTKILLRTSRTGVVLLRERPTDETVVSTFDYNDLNAYLLVVIGMGQPEPADVPVFARISQRAQDREAIAVRDIQPICQPDPLKTLSVTDSLLRAIELFGSGVRRILVTKPASSDVVGVLSQLRLLEFFWHEAVSFPLIDRLYAATLRDLRIGSQETIAINADRPLADALTLMHNEGLTSVAVVDNGLNVVGNISTRDVEHLTSVTSAPLLHSSCMHFISVILSERGVEEGRDSFPVFYVNPHSTLAHTVAKLVATRSHRMWIVDVPSPSPSAPQTPLLTPVHSSTSGLVSPGHGSGTAPEMATGETGSGNNSNNNNNNSNHSTNTTTNGGHSRRESTVLVPRATTPGTGPQSPLHGPTGNGGNVPGFASVPAAAFPGAHLSGRLTGVVSLTDILNLFARTTGLHPSDPAEIRARRRRSSSSSLRPSLDGIRTSIDLRR
ncbi:cbs domain containing protein [Niveomyces insectorum RCEF 264]|uniref:Protein SDS23 n=1 Tax=Niveomyces insectorum RCEF 264 TaxID=1081102 RepID=A0A167PTN6_9HYPO|nr:cbs domain containing protein [Niveomyces insectorum RCEF 264]